MFFFWATAAGVLALGGGLALSGAVSYLLPGTGKQRAIRIVRWIPAMGFTYLFGCVLVFSVWSSARGKDVGWGDTWETPVLGDYNLRMTDVTDQAILFDRTDSDVAAQGPIASSLGRRDAIVGVRQLEVRAPYLIGTASADSLHGQSPNPTKPLFFILDSRTGTRTDAVSLTALQSAAQKLGAPLKLSPVKDVYRRNRYDRADLVPLFAFIVPPVLGTWLLVRSFRRSRMKGETPTAFIADSARKTLGSSGLFLCFANGERRAPRNRYENFQQ